MAPSEESFPCISTFFSGRQWEHWLFLEAHGWIPKSLAERQKRFLLCLLPASQSGNIQTSLQAQQFTWKKSRQKYFLNVWKTTSIFDGLKVQLSIADSQMDVIVSLATTVGEEKGYDDSCMTLASSNSISNALISLAHCMKGVSSCDLIWYLTFPMPPWPGHGKRKSSFHSERQGRDANVWIQDLHLSFSRSFPTVLKECCENASKLCNDTSGNLALMCCWVAWNRELVGMCHNRPAVNSNRTRTGRALNDLTVAHKNESWVSAEHLHNSTGAEQEPRRKTGFHLDVVLWR